MAATETIGYVEGERMLYVCIGASIVVHVLAMLYSPRKEPPVPPVVQFKATLRSTPAASAPLAAPEPPRPEPVAEKPPVAPLPPPVPAAKPVPVVKPLPDKAVTKSAAPAPVPTPAAAPTPAAPAQPAAAPAPSNPAPAATSTEAPKAAAAASSADPSEKSLIDGYQAQLAQVAAKYKRYPNEAMQNNWEGTATVRLKIGADGKIAAVEIVTSSGQPILDEQASITVNKAKPFVQIPAGLRGKEFVASIRIVFSLKN